MIINIIGRYKILLKDINHNQFFQLKDYQEWF